MYLTTYDTLTGKIIASSVSLLDFGNIIQGLHSPFPLLFRCFPSTETAITDMTMSLQDAGSMNTQFSIYTDSSVTPGISSGKVPFTALTTDGTRIPVVDSTSYYIWLDMDTPPTSAGPAEASIKFTIDQP